MSLSGSLEGDKGVIKEKPKGIRLEVMTDLCSKVWDVLLQTPYVCKCVWSKGKGCGMSP